MNLQILPLDARRFLAACAFDILENIGVAISDVETLALLHTAGARCEGERVYIPPLMVQAALRSAPHRAESSLGVEVQFAAHVDAPDILDPLTHHRRPCQAADVRRNLALIETLPGIDLVTASGLVADLPASMGDRIAVSLCLQYSRKPVLAMPISLTALQDMHAMALLAAGSDESLRAHPRLVIYTEPVSPLLHPDESLRKVLYAAEHSLPLVYSGFAAMGATAPHDLHAIVAQLCAESLSGLVVHQLKRPGAPFIFGGMASLMDMRTTVFSYGAPEFQLGNAMLAEMAQFFDLPNFGTAGTSDAQDFNAQAVAEAASSIFLAMLSQAGLVHDIGLIGGATLVSPEMTLISHEIIAIYRALMQSALQAPADDLRTSALQALREVGPGGQFVTHPHTLAHFRQAWYPRLFSRASPRRLDDDFAQRLAQQCAERWVEPPKPILSREVTVEINRILEHAAGDAG